MSTLVSKCVLCFVHDIPFSSRVCRRRHRYGLCYEPPTICCFLLPFAVATDSIVFVQVFFSVTMVTHHPLHLDEILHENVPWLPLEPYWIPRSQIKGQGHFSLVDQSLPNCFRRTWEKIVVDNAIFRLLIAWSIPEIFMVKCSTSCALLIAHEPVHLAWWNFACTYTSTTSRTLLNF